MLYGIGETPEAAVIRAEDRLDAAKEALSKALARPGGRRRPGVWRAALREIRDAAEEAYRVGSLGREAGR